MSGLIHINNQLIYPDTNTGFDINYVKNQYSTVLLINNAISSYQTFVDSANASTFPIVFSPDCSADELLQVLRTRFTIIPRIGICFSLMYDSPTLFFEREPLFTETDTPELYSKSVELIINIIREFSINHIDFLACDTLQYANWQNYYALLTQTTGVVVGASDNKTGNIKYGGDWIMESSAEDIEMVYFTQSIEYYSYLLDTVPWVAVQGTGLTTDGTVLYSSIYGSIHKIIISSKSTTLDWVKNTSFPSNSTPSNVIPYDLYASAISGNYIYVRSYGSGTISKISLTNPYGDYALNYVTSPQSVGNGFGFDILGNYMYIGDGSNIRRINLLNTTDCSYSWATSAQGVPAAVNTLTIYNGNLYAIGYSNGVVTRINIQNPTTNYTASIATLGTGCRNMVCVNDYLYATSYNANKLSRLNLNNYTDVNTNFKSGYATGVTSDGVNIYAIGGTIAQIDQITIPLSIPKSTLTFDFGNTKTVSNGNLQVSISDTNVPSNQVYYFYSVSGDNISTYANTNVITNGPANTRFYIPNLLTDISYTVYVKASNSIGNSAAINTSVIVYTTPKPIANCAVSSISSGNIRISITETAPSTYYYLNGVSYWYYLYTTGPNLSGNNAAYTTGGSMNSSYTTDFVVQNQPANNYRVYVIAKNPIGNTVANAFSANVTVYTTPSSPNTYSLAFDDVSGITVTITDTTNTASNQVYYYYYYYRIGDTNPNQSTDISVYSNSFVPLTNSSPVSTFYISGLQTSYYNIYIAAKNSVGATIYSPVIAPINVICFKEDSRILTNRGYKKIQHLKKGDLVKTFNNGFKPIYMIGKKEIIHTPTDERSREHLYKCSATQYPEVFEDLVLTGCHSILVDEFVDETQRENAKRINGGIYITDKKYRLPVCADPMATIYEHAGKYTVYHIALENTDYYMNYGIYANGLLVESTSKRFLEEYSVMKSV